jgi:hypothetical protein
MAVGVKGVNCIDVCDTGIQGSEHVYHLLIEESRLITTFCNPQRQFFSTTNQYDCNEAYMRYIWAKELRGSTIQKMASVYARYYLLAPVMPINRQRPGFNAPIA